MNRKLPFVGGALVLALALAGTACSGAARVLAPERPTPVPTATPNPRDVPPPGAEMTPYAVERLILDTLPFPANTVLINSLQVSYQGDGTWRGQAVLVERVRTPGTGADPGLAEEVTTHFAWVVDDRRRQISQINPAGERWLAEHWHPGP